MTVHKDSNNNEYEVSGNTLYIRMGEQGSGAIPNFTAESKVIGTVVPTSEMTGVRKIEFTNIGQIGTYAFYNEGWLYEISFTDLGTVSILDYAFANDGYLTRITFGSGTYSFGRYSFYKCGLSEVTVLPNTSALAEGCFKDTGISVTYPPMILPSQIGVSAFEKCSFLRLNALNDYVTLIGDRAFCDSDVRMSKLPKHIYKIGDYAFKGSRVEFIDITTDSTEGLTIGANAFERCNYLSAKYISNIESIGEYAFKDSTAVPEEINVRHINMIWNKGIFRGCLITKFHWRTDSAIPDEMFQNCPMQEFYIERYNLLSRPSASAITMGGATVIYVPFTLYQDYRNSWGTYSNYIVAMRKDYDSNMNEYTLTQSTGSIEYNTLAVSKGKQGNGVLTGLRSFPSDVFHLDITEGITEVAMDIFRGLSLQTVDLPQTLTRVNSRTFQDLTSLTEPIVLPDNITQICAGAFKNTAVSPKLPAMLRTIESYALNNISGNQINLKFPTSFVKAELDAIGGSINALTFATSVPPEFAQQSSVTVSNVYVPYSEDGSVLTAYMTAIPQYATVMTESGKNYPNSIVSSVRISGVLKASQATQPGEAVVLGDDGYIPKSFCPPTICENGKMNRYYDNIGGEAMSLVGVYQTYADSQALRTEMDTRYTNGDTSVLYDQFMILTDENNSNRVSIYTFNGVGTYIRQNIYINAFGNVSSASANQIMYLKNGELTDGMTFLSGTSAPLDSEGKIGDVYFRIVE